MTFCWEDCCIWDWWEVNIVDRSCKFRICQFISFILVINKEELFFTLVASSPIPVWSIVAFQSQMLQLVTICLNYCWYQSSFRLERSFTALLNRDLSIGARVVCHILRECYYIYHSYSFFYFYFLKKYWVYCSSVKFLSKIISMYVSWFFFKRWHLQ